MKKNGKSIDRLDLALLNLVQRNNLLSADEMAKEIPLSGSAITRRLRRLRQNKIIVGDRSVLNQRFLDERLSGLVQIQLARHAPDKGLKELKELLNESDEVQLCLEISGAHDILLLVTVRDMNDFNQFADRVLATHPAVHRYETSFVKKVVKTSFVIPLNDHDLTS